MEQLIDHSIDHIGKTVGLFRYRNESVQEFQERIEQVFQFPPSSTIIGLTAGASRELGGKLEKILSIEFDKELTDEPCIICTSTHLYIYSNYSNNIKTAFNLVEDNPEVESTYYLNDIVDYLNGLDANIVFFKEENNIRKEASKFLVPFSSVQLIPESIELRNQVTYLGESIIKGSVVSNSKYIIDEVSSWESITKKGEYCIDYKNGIIWTYPTEEPMGSVNLQTYSYEFSIWLAPVKIDSLIEEKYIKSFIHESGKHSIENEYMDSFKEKVLNCINADKNFWYSKNQKNNIIDIERDILNYENIIEAKESYSRFKEKGI